jgi:hypothetical protein
MLSIRGQRLINVTRGLETERSTLLIAKDF